MQENPVFAQRALAAGAVGFVLKDRAAEELPEAIRMAARGEQYVSPRLALPLDDMRRASLEDRLTVREVEVLRLIALGHTSAEIAPSCTFRHARSRTIARGSIASSGLRRARSWSRYALRRGMLRA